ncbi:MAG: 16S rRNA processing protein RimM [Vicinamibacteria bacterium]|nr:16S rRNA processing protein RimM [Vicinamibacteria bacterium]
MNFSELVVIGQVVRPQGRFGELLVESLSDRPERFPSLRRAFMESPPEGAEEVRVVSCRPHGKRWVLKLSGVEGIDGAARLRGRKLAIPEADLAPLPDGFFYHHQLRGLVVESGSSETLGRVEDVVETGAATVLVIRDGSREILVPFAESFIRSVRLDEGRIVVALQKVVDAVD